MKDFNDPLDQQMRDLLQEHAPNVAPNKWFTHRVLNRLPAHRPAFWAGKLMYAIALAVLAWCWYWLVTDAAASQVITVTDMLQYLAVVVMTAVAALSLCRPHVLTRLLSAFD